MICIRRIIVIIQFTVNIGSDQQETGEADGQAKHVDDRKHFVLPDIPECDLEEITDHLRIFKAFRASWMPGFYPYDNQMPAQNKLWELFDFDTMIVR